MNNTLRADVSPVQIYVAHSSGADAPWRVCEDGTEAGSYEAVDAAIVAACERARALGEVGFDVPVKQEKMDGSWHVVRE